MATPGNSAFGQSRGRKVRARGKAGAPGQRKKVAAAPVPGPHANKKASFKPVGIGKAPSGTTTRPIAPLPLGPKPTVTPVGSTTLRPIAPRPSPAGTMPPAPVEALRPGAKPPGFGAGPKPTGTGFGGLGFGGSAKPLPLGPKPRGFNTSGKKRPSGGTLPLRGK